MIECRTRFTKEQKAFLKKEAKRRKCSEAEVVRNAIENYRGFLIETEIIKKTHYKVNL